MIEGLKVHIRGEKLAKVIDGKVEGLRNKAAKLKEMLSVAQINEPSMNSNKAGLEERTADLLAQADELAFISEHLNKGDLYQLDSDDLRKIQIVRQRW